MTTLWRAGDRGATDQAGLARRHQFSSGAYFDRTRCGFGAIRVLDEICLAAGATIESERRANMEILTWVIDGQVDLAIGDANHVLRKGGLACVSAGSGIDCAARNGGASHARVMQVWLQPTVVNAKPRSTVRHYDDAELRDGFRKVAASVCNDAESSLRLDAKLCVARADSGQRLRYPLSKAGNAWLQVLRGGIAFGDVDASSGDALEFHDGEIIDLRVREDGEFLLIDLAGRSTQVRQTPSA